MELTHETTGNAAVFQIPLQFSTNLSDLITSFIDLYWFLRRSVLRNIHEGMYEIIDYDSTLELVDPKGKTAVFRRQERVKFLQDDTITFQDRAWGEGDIFADYKCSPGIIADRYQVGDQWFILISLRETKKSGDIEDFYIERKVQDGFTKDEEWRQTDIHFKMKKIKLSVIFPKERWCKRAFLVERNRNRTTPLGEDCFHELPDKRQVLTWEMENPRRFETYIIRWRW